MAEDRAVAPGGVKDRIVRSLVSWTWGGTILVAVGTVLGFTGRLAWWLELSSHFRLQLFYGAVVALAVFGLLRRRRGVVLALLLCAVNGVVLAPAYFPHAEELAGRVERPVLRLLVANVHTSNRDYGRLLDLVRSEKPDLLLLQETDREWLSALAALAADYPHRIARPRPDNFGIAVLSRVPFESKALRFLGAAGVPSVEVGVVHGGRRFQVLLTHALPPVNRRNAMLRDGQTEAVARAARALGDRTIVAGDLNMTPWSPVFVDLLEASGLRDSARGFGVQTTWPMTLPLPCRIPIDHCLHTSDLEVVERRGGPDIGSDHLPLIIGLR